MKKTHKWMIIEIVVIVTVVCFGCWEVKKVTDKQKRTGHVDLGVIVVHPEKRGCPILTRFIPLQAGQEWRCSCGFSADWRTLGD